MRISRVCFPGSGIGGLPLPGGRGQNNGEAATRLPGFVKEIAAEDAQDRTRDVEAEPGRIRAALEGAEEALGRRNSDSRVPKADQDRASLGGPADIEAFRLRGRHGSLTILGEVQEDLQEAVPVG